MINLSKTTGRILPHIQRLPAHPRQHRRHTPQIHVQKPVNQIQQLRITVGSRCTGPARCLLLPQRQSLKDLLLQLTRVVHCHRPTSTRYHCHRTHVSTPCYH